MRSLLKHIWSYLLGLKLQEYDSPINGKLELWLINGKKVLNSANANYSFDSLHEVFQKAFSKSNLSLPAEAQVLILGFGCGSVAHILQHEMHFNCQVTGVDIDPLLFQIAEEHFHAKAYTNLRCEVADAFSYMEQNTTCYDLIVMDLFVDNKTPEKFSNTSFCEALKKALKPHGKLYINLIDSTKEGKESLKKLQDAFYPHQLVQPISGNKVLVFG